MISAELSFFLKVNLAFVLFYAFYRLCLTHDTFFRWRRFTLLAFLAVGWLYPLMNLQTWFPAQISVHPLQEAVVYAQILYTETFVIQPAAIPTATPSLSLFSFQTLVWIYFAGVAALGARFFVQLLLITRLVRRSRTINVQGTPVRLLGKKSGPFSFFHWIFIHRDELENTSKTNEILAHELTHSRQFHSLDVLLSELNCILCWMNPFAWLLQREVRTNLEYLADNQVVLTGYDTKIYQYHLLGLANTQVATTLYNHFNVLPLKKRIMMMNKKRTRKIGRTKYVLFLPLVAGLILVSHIETVARTTGEMYTKITESISAVTSFESEKPTVTEPDKKDSKTLSTLSIAVKSEQKNPESPTLNTKIVYTPTTPLEADELEYAREDLAKRHNVPKEDIEVGKVITDQKELDAIGPNMTKMITYKKKNKETGEWTFHALASGSTTVTHFDGEVENPEKQAQFPGGEQALYKFLAENLKYPEKAQKDRLQGKVVTGFYIEKDGSITEAKIIRSLSPETDKECLRVLHIMPKWEPAENKGEPVRTYFVLPFTFHLSDPKE